MGTLGDYATGTEGPKDSPKIEGRFSGMIEHAELVLDEENQPKMNDYGKHQMDVTVRIDHDTTLRRRMSISFGASGGKYAALAELIQAALSIPCGDKRQRTIQLSDLEGKEIAGLATVNDRGYTDIIKWLPGNAKPTGKPMTREQERDEVAEILAPY